MVQVFIVAGRICVCVCVCVSVCLSPRHTPLPIRSTLQTFTDWGWMKGPGDPNPRTLARKLLYLPQLLAKDKYTSYSFVCF